MIKKRNGFTKTEDPFNGYAFIILGLILAVYGVVKIVRDSVSDSYIFVIGLVLVLAGYAKLKDNKPQ